MIAAARADGHLDEAEKQRIMLKMQDQKFDDAVLDFLRTEIQSEVPVDFLAGLATSPEMAAEMYLAARVVIDAENQSEGEWLAELRDALKLAPELVAQMESDLA